jgi:alpha-L-fucosidase
MKSYKLLLAFTLFLAFAFNMKAQYVHERSDQYTPPEDSLVIQKLHHWQDQKFGMLIHWGLYSVAGIVESWSICSEEADWIPRDSTMAYEDYKNGIGG